ncbi:hypothetical protein ANN_01984 [Periplaneta americana]|uniref:Uncharacterized protein n=1 Tax=Periplaneta americana TaxID=6978 RepID=A0ABQ8TY01_PERAM|nr:hypothetical protein ANN_01984 [Periplaneta americana]
MAGLYEGGNEPPGSLKATSQTTFTSAVVGRDFSSVYTRVCTYFINIIIVIITLKLNMFLAARDLCPANHHTADEQSRLKSTIGMILFQLTAYEQTRPYSSREIDSMSNIISIKYTNRFP